MKQLKNVQHDFSVSVGDIGVTVRLGDKWAKEPIGSIIALWECPTPHINDCVAATENHDVACCQYRGTARILGSWQGQLIDIPAMLLGLEHEPSSREWNGLVESLRRGYGDSVSPASHVTALIYLRETIA